MNANVTPTETKMKPAVRELHEMADDLEEMKEQIEELLYMMKQILREAPKHIQNSSRAYWISNIEISLGNNHAWAARGGYTLEKAIQDLRDFAPDEDGA